MNAQEPIGAELAAAAAADNSPSTTSLVILAAGLRPAGPTVASLVASSSSASPQQPLPPPPPLLQAPLAAAAVARVNFNFCSEVDVNETVRLIMPKIDMSVYYVYVCPVVISVCFFSIIFNATLMSISRQCKLINKSPILLLSLNLAVTDLIASALNGLNILLVSYLKMVHKIPIDTCSVLILELLRYSATLASALHLLALAFVHYRGTVNPLQYRSRIFYSQHLSRTINIISICCWLLPLTLMIVWFNSIPCQGFKPAKCDYLFLLGFAFRYMILIVFSVPLLLMCIIYVRIFLFISRHQKGFVFAASSASKAAKQTPGATYQRPPEAIEGATDSQAVVTRRRSADERFCPMCSLAIGDGDADELLEVESVTILSEESNESSASGDELESASSTQLQPAAVSLVHNDRDDSYTIKSKESRADGGAKSNCNDRPGMAAPPVASLTQIDNDPALRHGRPAQVAPDSGDDAQTGLMPDKLDCERQAAARGRTAQEVTAGARPLADHGRDGGGQRQVAVAAARQSDSNNEEEEEEEEEHATARPLLAEGGMASSPRDSGGLEASSDSLRALEQTSDAAELKLPGSEQIASARSACTPTAYRRHATQRASKAGSSDGTSSGTDNNYIKNRPAATLLRCTCDNKLNQSTTKPLRRSNTLATTAGKAADVATRRRTLTTRTSAKLAAAAETTNTRAATTSKRCKLNLKPSISSRLSGSASAAAATATAAAMPDSSFRSAAGSGGGCDSEPDSGSSSSSDASFSSGADGRGCARNPNGRLQQGAARGPAATGPSMRARLFQLGAKSSSLRAHPEAASLTVTTLTSGHPAHTNFSSASSSLNNHNHLNHLRHQSNSLNLKHHKHKHKRHHHHRRHHHHHHHDDPHEPQRLNSKRNAVPPTNTKALVTTLLILGTYIVSYLPAILFSALTCIDSAYCPYPLYTVPERVRLLFGTMTMLLLIAKSIVDPLIYSYRMNEIQQAISRYMSKRRSKSSSRATSIYTNSQRFGPIRAQATQTSLRGPPSRATSVRINQHQFDRPCQSAGGGQQQVSAACLVGESRIDELEEECGGGEQAAVGRGANSATAPSRVSETIVSFSGDTERSIANDKLESPGALNIPRRPTPLACDGARERSTPGEPKATDRTATIASGLVC